MAWCRQATSHYLSRCWPRSLSPYDVTRPQWVNNIPVFTQLYTLRLYWIFFFDKIVIFHTYEYSHICIFTHMYILFSHRNIPVWSWCTILLTILAAWFTMTDVHQICLGDSLTAGLHGCDSNATWRLPQYLSRHWCKVTKILLINFSGKFPFLRK